MKNTKPYNFAIIGLGMVGTAIGHLLKNSGHKIVSICDKSPTALKRALPLTGGRTFYASRDAVIKADTILITVPDDAIFAVCNEIASTDLTRGKFVFHMSGAGGLDLLEAAKKVGAITASIHPLQSFSSVDNAIQNIPGSFFGITADKKAEKQAEKIVRDLTGIPILISPDQKPLYHAAASIASNYLVSLFNVVESIYETIGISKKNARKAFLPLIYGTLKNIEMSGSTSALTGPIARGDAGTIRKHIASIKEAKPEYLPLYSDLGLVTVKIAQKKGTLSSKQAKNISDLLKGVSNHEHSK
jgi:predicted short-subunit dehydrogenase-like oxidoreductase (DUF2520 family)